MSRSRFMMMSLITLLVVTMLATSLVVGEFIANTFAASESVDSPG